MAGLIYTHQWHVATGSVRGGKLQCTLSELFFQSRWEVTSEVSQAGNLLVKVLAYSLASAVDGGMIFITHQGCVPGYLQGVPRLFEDLFDDDMMNLSIDIYRIYLVCIIPNV